MNSDENKNKADALRQQAEDLMNQSTNTYKRSQLKDVKKLAHEVNVYQTELELQNEELRNTQLELQKTRDRFAALFRHAPVGYVVLDASGLIRQTNATWSAMIGGSDETFEGQPFADFILAEDTAIFLSRFRAFFRQPAEKQIVVRIKRVGKKPIWAQIEAKPQSIHTENESSFDNELMLIISDISARKKVEMDLRASQERLQLALDSANQGMWEWDLEKNQVFFDTGAMRMLGYTQADFDTDENFVLNLIHPDEKDFILQIAENYISGKIDTYDVEFRLRRKDGAYAWIWSVGKIASHDKKGKPTRLIGIHRDITDRKNAEQKIHESEMLFRSVFESANVGKSITRPDGRISPNKAFCDMLGYNQKEMQNKTWREITPSEDIEPIAAVLAPLLSGKQDSARFEKRYIRKNGACLWADVSVVLHRDAGGNPVYFIATVVDITERRHARDELKKQMQELEIFNDAAVDREILINEHRKEINQLLIKLGESAKYEIVE